MLSDDFTIEAQSLKDWTVQKALPFWAENARDSNGGFYEDLSLEGRPNKKAIRRVRVQARQVFVYAQATKLRWFDGISVADGAYDFMYKYGYARDGAPGFAHLINPNYTVHDGKRDLYDHAFFSLACASLMGCNSSKRRDAAAELNDRLLDFIDLEMGACKGWVEGVPAVLPRRQNPHMHLFETSMALYDATQNAAYLERAARIYSLFETYFFDSKYAVIREFFDENWIPVKGIIGETAEPGHACEWVWLLWQYQRRTGVDTRRYRRALYETAFADGDIFLNDESDIFGNKRRSTRRLWVQTEVIRAHLAMMEAGSKGAQKRAMLTIQRFKAEYLNDNGTWNDCFDNTGKMTAKAIPTSTFYHIIGMVSEAARIAQIN